VGGVGGQPRTAMTPSHSVQGAADKQKAAEHAKEEKAAGKAAGPTEEVRSLAVALLCLLCSAAHTGCTDGGLQLLDGV